MGAVRDKQSRFAKAAAELILKAYELGYEVTFGDAYRDPRVFGNPGVQKGYGRSKSLHKQRLAIDLNLFIDGRYITDSEGHEKLGEWWEETYEEASWGGRFADYNHYSFHHRGMR